MKSEPRSSTSRLGSALSRFLLGRAKAADRGYARADMAGAHGSATMRQGARSATPAPPSPYPLDHAPGPEDPYAGLRGTRILFDGVLKGDYSLAIVNRQLARALLQAGVDLVLHSGEDDLASDAALTAMPDVNARLVARRPTEAVDLHLRNTWPPQADDMQGSVNAYVCFAWEESTVPRAMVNHFNAHLDLLMVTSHFVADAFRRSGLRIPVDVVGNGVDHLTVGAGDTARPTQPADGPRRILHVSSCFPRKGADVLVETFAANFTPKDDVELVIKTFDNAHNTIDDHVEAARLAHPEAAPITVLKQSMTDAALRDLMRSSAALAAPSRGEGFGLPLAEATMLGVPVVTTGYSGQADFCTDRTAWLVDYRLEQSSAHVTAGDGALWAEPDPTDLARTLRSALGQPDDARCRVEAGQSLLSRHFTWSRVARRVALALGRWQRRPAPAAGRIADVDLVSSWNQTCGIATYASHLFSTEALSPRLRHVHARRLNDDDVEIDARQDIGVSRSWGFDREALHALASDLVASRAPILWLQHHPGHFSDADMTALCDALAPVEHAARVITLHNARETLDQPGRWLASFDVVIVHTDADRALLAARADNAVAVIPHGIPSAPADHQPDPRHVTVGMFGFLYPHKNVPLLLEAVAIASTYEPRLRLRLLTCARNDTVSLKERSRVEATIAALNLDDRVEVDFRFLDEETIRARLSGCDLICFPYGPSSESATGAARIALSLDRPILCSTSDVLSDIRPYALGIPKLDRETLAEALIVLSGSVRLRDLRALERRNVVAKHCYEHIGAQHARLLDRVTGRVADAA
ncbi:MAG: glycosyltransferase [Pseudomonadota bacterium]